MAGEDQTRRIQNPLDKEDSYVQAYMGSSYRFSGIKNVGQLRGLLERIAADLPGEDNLEISEVDLRNNKLTYTLKEGIFQ